MTHEQLRALGLEHLVFVKPIMLEGNQVQQVCAADGTPLCLIENRAVAFATAQQHEMMPQSVH